MTDDVLVWMIVYGVMSASHGWLSQTSPVSSPWTLLERSSPHSHTLLFTIAHAADRPLHLFLRPHALSRLYGPAGSAAGRAGCFGGGGGNKAMLHFLENWTLLFLSTLYGFSLSKRAELLLLCFWKNTNNILNYNKVRTHPWKCHLGQKTCTQGCCRFCLTTDPWWLIELWLNVMTVV